MLTKTQNNMKKLLLIATAIFIALTVRGQYHYPIERYGEGTMPFDENGKVVFSKVIQVEEMNKDAIYNSAKLFVVNMFKNANNTIQMDDNINGIIIAKGMSMQSTSNGFAQCVREVWFTLKIQARDNRFKIDVYDMHSELTAYGTTMKKYAEELTDAKCLKANGTIKPAGDGVWRRLIQDCAFYLIESAEREIKPTINNVESDW